LRPPRQRSLGACLQRFLQGSMLFMVYSQSRNHC
jgi:hypothetical protein